MSCQISAVDLFCGAGGLTCGLEDAGISVEAGIDNRETCRLPYEENNEADFLCEDLRDIGTNRPELVGELFDENADLRVLAGCPPCQPFSPLTNGETSADHDSYPLLDAFWDIVDHVQPDIVVMENVHNVYKADIYQKFEENMAQCGYDLNPHRDREVYCPNYGIPQSRTRWVTLAAKDGFPTIPEQTIGDQDRDTTVKEAIEKLPSLEAGETDPGDNLHSARELEDKNLRRIRESRPGRTWRDWPKELRLDCHTKDSGQSYDSVYGRMLPNRPAPTITTQFYNLGSGRFGHYDTEQDRALSLREGALLQTFPKGYKFFEETENVGIKEAGKLIGNAVPPKLGEFIGERIRVFYEGTDKQSEINSFVERGESTPNQ